MIIDEKAEALERAGLYRRAARRWLVVFDRCICAVAREEIARRRIECLDKVALPKVNLDDFGDVRKAANETQQRMGILRKNGDAFRLYAKGKQRD